MNYAFNVQAARSSAPPWWKIVGLYPRKTSRLGTLPTLYWDWMKCIFHFLSSLMDPGPAVLHQNSKPAQPWSQKIKLPQQAKWTWTEFETTQFLAAGFRLMHFKDSKTNRSRTYGSDPFTLIGLLEMLGKSTSKEICELVFSQCSSVEIRT